MPKRTKFTLATLGLVALGISYFLLQDHTTYAPKFSRSKFFLIRPGLSEDRVIVFVGPPLGEEIGPFGEVWHYERSLLKFNKEGLSGLIVTFGMNGTVADLMGDPRAVAHAGIRPGMSATEVLAAAGAPASIEPSYARKAWYSKPEHNAGRYYNFAVLYDTSGRVIDTEAGWDWD
jgi:hypothetical protein